ncbi:dicarboxylate/amino acid:cation symporter [Sphingomonas daechungensis]|uniref:dicarboxylate/amino acid:cation symporter n=1 Tax=Sphingomonas daechungensis TaxID=1176646 RepID=UPI0037852FA1
MTTADRAEEAAAKPIRGGRPYLVLIALILGLIAGVIAQRTGDGLREPALQATNLIGGLWLNALKMTVIPLVVALLITGVAAGAEAARAGKIAARSVLWIVILCTASAIFGAVAVTLLTGAFPLPEAQAQAMQAGLAGLDQSVASGPMPAAIDFFKGVIPGNVISAAANGDVLPLVVFALLFALAVARIDVTRRRSIVELFQGIADALLIIIGWVLLIAPLGVFALAFSVGASAGGAAFAGLGHYILVISAIGVLVTLWAYPIALIWGRIGLATFSKGLIAPQSVAISTRSSLASLPAMLGAAKVLGVREQVADVTLPLAVALFRATGPAMNTAVAFYVAHWLGYEPTMAQMIAATAVGAVMSYGAVSLPGEVSFISSIAPIAMALGVPIAPLALLVAVEMVPDIFRTLGNVTLDVAVTTVVNKSTESVSSED